MIFNFGKFLLKNLVREVYFYQFYVVLLLYFLSLLTSGKNITETSFRKFLFHFTQLIRLSNTVSRILFRSGQDLKVRSYICNHRGSSCGEVMRWSFSTSLS